MKHVNTSDIRARPTQAVRHIFGQLPRNASLRERAARERLIRAFVVLMRHEKGKVQPKHIVAGARRYWRTSFVRRHPDLEPSLSLW